MTVAELIALLATYPQDHIVWVEPGDYAASDGHLMVSPTGLRFNATEVGIP